MKLSLVPDFGHTVGGLALLSAATSESCIECENVLFPEHKASKANSISFGETVAKRPEDEMAVSPA